MDYRVVRRHCPGLLFILKNKAERRHRIPQQRRRVANSAIYDFALPQRACPTVDSLMQQPRAGKLSRKQHEVTSGVVRSWRWLRC